ncbi:MAG: hypothetical protein ACOX4W_04220 [Bacilli bacterium]
MNEFLEQINSLNKKTIDDILVVLEKEEKIYNSYYEKEIKVIDKGNIYFENLEKEISDLINVRLTNYEELKKVIKAKKLEYNKVVEEKLTSELVENEIKKFQKVKGMSIKSIIEPLKRKIQEAESQLTILEKDITSKIKEIKQKREDAKKTYRAKSIDIKRRFDKEVAKLNKELDIKTLPLEQEMAPETNKKRIAELKREIKKIRLTGLSDEKNLKINNIKEKENLEKEHLIFNENLDLDLKLLDIHNERRTAELKSIQKNLQLEIECEEDLYDFKSKIKSYENIKANYFDSIQQKISIKEEIKVLKNDLLDAKSLEEDDKKAKHLVGNEYFIKFQENFLENIEKFSNEELTKSLNAFEALKTSLLKYFEINYAILEKILFQYYDYKNKFLFALLEALKTNIPKLKSFGLEKFIEIFDVQIQNTFKKHNMFLNEFKIELKAFFKEISKHVVEKYESLITIYKKSIEDDLEMIAKMKELNISLNNENKEKYDLGFNNSKNEIKLQREKDEKAHFDTIKELDSLKTEFENSCSLEISEQQVLIDRREKEFLLARGSEIISKGDMILEIDKREQNIKIASEEKIKDAIKEITSRYKMQITEIEKDIVLKIKML